MRRTSLSVAVLLVAVAIIVACTDRTTPTAPAQSLQRVRSLNGPTGCFDKSSIETLIRTVFAPGSPHPLLALAKFAQIVIRVERRDIPGAQQAARDLISFLQQRAAYVTNHAQVQLLIDSLECYVGITNDTFLVYPSDQPQTIVNGAGTAGVQLPANPVSEPTLITVTLLPPTGPAPLDTKLDQYPGYVEITQQSGTSNSLVVPVVVAVCPANVPTGVYPHLRLGHQKSTGFELTPPADGSFLNCSGVASASSRLPAWARQLASLVLPKPLYARMLFSGGIGGTATEFSPFAPVDAELSFTGGVGGSATEFLREPTSPTPAPDAATKTTSTTRQSVAPGTPTPPSAPNVPKTTSEMAIRYANVIDCGQANVGTALPAECRPRVTLTTHNGTVMQNVPMAFAIGQGGGTTAIDDPVTRTCGTFGSSASTTTNVNGRAGACWTLGAEAGTNTLIATPSAGGDAPPGVTFTPATSTFTVTALKNTSAILLTGLSQTYTGSPISVTATTTPLGLSTVTITYNGVPTPPTSAGSYAVVATLSNPSYDGTASGSLVISQASQTTLVATGPATASFGDAAVPLGTTGGNGTGAVSFNVGTSTACSVTSGGLLSITSGTGTCSVTATKAGDTNYGPVTSDPITITPMKAAALVVVSGFSGPYDGLAHGATGTATGVGSADVSASLNLGSTFTDAPGGTASWTFTGGVNYADQNGTAAVVINQTSATVNLADMSQTYTGAPLSPTATTVPAGLSLAWTGATQTLAGSYSVTATITNPNYTGAASGTFVIGRATQTTLTLTAPPSATYGAGTVQVGVLGGAGSGAVAYDASTTPAACSVNATSGVVSILTGTGNCVVSAMKAGDNNYDATTSASSTIALNRANQSISFAPLGDKNYGDASFLVSATATSGLPVTFTAGAGSQCTVSGSTVTLSGAGGCTVRASQAGNANFYNAASDVLQGFSIAKRTASATAGSGTMLFGGTVPTLPCAVGGLLTPDAGSVSCATVVPPITAAGTLATTPSVSPASPLNYTVALVNGTLTVAAYVQQGCFASPLITSVTAPSTTGITKGTTITVKCRLVEPSGRPIVTAKGSLQVDERGTNGLLPPGPPVTPAYSGTNVFTTFNDGDFDDNDGIYTFKLSTSPTVFIKGHYYLVTATWNDGTTTKGWFKLKL